MSFSQTNRFIKEFNNLDKILKDMYPEQVQSKLGVTRYLEDMKSQENEGLRKVRGWKNDYETLRILRNNRNSAIHDNMLDADLFSETDIEWIVEFRIRLLKQKDPLSMLRISRNSSKNSVEYPQNYRQIHYTDSDKNNSNKYLIWIALIIAAIFFLMSNTNAI